MTSPSPDTAQALIGKTVLDDGEEGIIDAVDNLRRWGNHPPTDAWVIFAVFGVGDKRAFKPEEIELKS